MLCADCTAGQLFAPRFDDQRALLQKRCDGHGYQQRHQRGASMSSNLHFETEFIHCESPWWGFQKL